MIPAVVLAEMEKRSGKRIAAMFDLVAGTSTGGIPALGLLTPARARFNIELTKVSHFSNTFSALKISTLIHLG